jgi:hypothetical protein
MVFTVATEVVHDANMLYRGKGAKKKSGSGIKFQTTYTVMDGLNGMKAGILPRRRKDAEECLKEVHSFRSMHSVVPRKNPDPEFNFKHLIRLNKDRPGGRQEILPRRRKDAEECLNEVHSFICLHSVVPRKNPYPEFNFKHLIRVNKDRPGGRQEILPRRRKDAEECLKEVHSFRSVHSLAARKNPVMLWGPDGILSFFKF